MKMLEVRRHAHRKHGGGSQLSQEGVAYARKLGANLGPFACVVTSVAPRARETAIAMGFATDREVFTLLSNEAVFAEMERSQWWKAPQSFAALAGLMASKGETWRYGASLAALWRDVLTPLPDDAAALAISHSGEIELGLVACFPDADHAAWGGGFAPCEGARLYFEGEPERFTRIELLRGELV
jgi:broad specificity phosphatase PhoE